MRPMAAAAFRFVPGPVFCQLLMADEINRASPRTQSALLQAMQEQRVAIGGVEHVLPRPFHVLATQNPIEQEGTYPLPEAQLDRFLLEIDVSYPRWKPNGPCCWRRPVRPRLGRQPGADCRGSDRRPGTDPPRAGGREGGRCDPVAGPRRPAGEHDGRYGAPPCCLGPRSARRTGPDAGRRARALFDGRLAPSIDDVVALARPVLRHRMALNFAARADGVALGDVIDRLVERLA